jgi:hypothetical protein
MSAIESVSTCQTLGPALLILDPKGAPPKLLHRRPSPTVTKMPTCFCLHIIVAETKAALQIQQKNSSEQKNSSGQKMAASTLVSSVSSFK